MHVLIPAGSHLDAAGGRRLHVRMRPDGRRADLIWAELEWLEKNLH
jgi:hypothetical protein